MKLKDVKVGMQVCYEGDITDVYTVIRILKKTVKCIQNFEGEEYFYNFEPEKLQPFDPETAKLIILDMQNDINQANSHLEKTFQLLLALKEKATKNGMENPFNKEVLAWQEFYHTLSNGPYYWRISSLECY